MPRTGEKPLHKFSYKEKEFCAAYVKNKGNGTQAALIAYETDKEASAAQIAWELLQKPHIQARIAKLKSYLNYTLQDAIVDAHDTIEQCYARGNLRELREARKYLSELQGLMVQKTQALPTLPIPLELFGPNPRQINALPAILRVK